MAFSISKETVRNPDEQRRRIPSPLTSKAVQFELVDPIDRLGSLPVVLNKVEVIGGGEQARKGRSF